MRREPGQLADKPVAQVELARAEGSLAATRSFFYETVSDLWRTVRDGAQPTPRQIALNRIAAAGATYVWEDAGRVFLGREPTAPMF